MKILVKNHFENATQALRANRGRTFLTIVGVAIGIASITMVLSLTGGFNHLFGDNSNQSSTPVAIVKSGNQKAVPNLLTESDNTTTVNTLTETDARDIEKIANTKAAPIAFLHAELRAREGKVDIQNAALIGSTESLKDVANLQIATGQFINDIGGVVVGQQLSVDLFGTERSIGNVIYIRNQPLTVVGVLKNIENQASYLDVNFNNAAIIPLSVIKKFTQGTPQIQQIIVTTKDHKNLNSVIKSADDILKKNHDSDKNYRIVSGEEINEKKSNVARFISIILTVIGIISLLIGGIGIMNVMLVNVAERQREVGVRRAVGATGWDIINQFLIEAAIIGFLGGVLGYGLGLAGAYIASLYLPLTPYIYWQTAVLSIGLSIIIGVISGVYPAARATRRDPIDLYDIKLTKFRFNFSIQLNWTRIDSIKNSRVNTSRVSQHQSPQQLFHKRLSSKFQYVRLWSLTAQQSITQLHSLTNPVPLQIATNIKNRKRLLYWMRRPADKFIVIKFWILIRERQILCRFIPANFPLIRQRPSQFTTKNNQRLANC